MTSIPSGVPADLARAGGFYSAFAEQARQHNDRRRERDT
jgi:hypothetical protein